MRASLAVSLLILLILSAAALGFSAPASAQPAPQDRTLTPKPPMPVDVTDACREAVDGIDALRADLEMPDHLMQENAPRLSTDFDVNTYFTVLDRLAMQKGYALDYVYLYQGIGGYPVLYARPEDEAPFLSSADFQAEYGSRWSEWPDYHVHIRIDDTPEGYLQSAVLSVMDSQFYLHWHANYNDHRIVCDQDALEMVLADMAFGQAIPNDVQTAARALDLTPTVALDEDAAHVRLVIFTKWGGFSRATFTISREFPHETTVEVINLVPYDCGVMF